MNRRTFLRTLTSAAVTVAVAPTILETLAIAPAPPVYDFIDACGAQQAAMDAQTGIAIRFVRHFDIQAAQMVSRLDVCDPSLMPSLACHIENA